MKRSIARKWAKALESGEYKQGYGRLRSGSAFCCLGLLCNLHAQEHPEIAKQQKRKSEYLYSDLSTPRQVMDWAGLRHKEGRFKNIKIVVEGQNYTLLSELNDEAKLTFPEIAKIIRKHWKEL